MLKDSVRGGLEGLRLAGMTASQESEPPHVRTVQNALGDASIELVSLDKAITALVDALGPALLADAVARNPETQYARTPSNSCALVGSIDDLTDRIKWQRDEIVSILTNLNIG